MNELALFTVDNPESDTNPGEVEQAFIEQIDFLEKQKVMTAAHSGLKRLVLRSARAVDRIKPTDAASGQANLIKALNEVAAALPEPKAEEASVIDALMDLFAVDTAEPGEYDEAPASE